ncbi:hypothetical protein BDN72DRAFT_896073 [Pluteus cervinus]|uniref:Uncharacterized protein n=1 Tax=Pluteus cervinus TaxID=181527 RepID=A0ACD3AYP1_9AGAR|nr:hypothetical protein BDN72DRAFT_896073 [Pluteus cervinus]
MTLDTTSPDYCLFAHLLSHCYSGIVIECFANKPDPTSQLLFTPSANGYKEALSSAVTPLVVSYVTGLQYDSKSKEVILAISTNAPQESHEGLETYVKKIWEILRRLASLPRGQDTLKLLFELQGAVFARTLPKLQDRLDTFRPICEEWVSVLDDLLKNKKNTKPPSSNNPTSQLAATGTNNPPFRDRLTRQFLQYYWLTSVARSSRPMMPTATHLRKP